MFFTTECESKLEIKAKTKNIPWDYLPSTDFFLSYFQYGKCTSKRVHAFLTFSVLGMNKFKFGLCFFGLTIVACQSGNDKKDTFVLLDSEIANGSSITMIIQWNRRSNSMLLGGNSAGWIMDPILPQCHIFVAIVRPEPIGRMVAVTRGSLATFLFKAWMWTATFSITDMGWPYLYEES